MQVENVALLANAPDNEFVGVNLYCADDAASWDAPTNLRASQISACCGKPLDVSLLCGCSFSLASHGTRTAG